MPSVERLFAKQESEFCYKREQSQACLCYAECNRILIEIVKSEPTVFEPKVKKWQKIYKKSVSSVGDKQNFLSPKAQRPLVPCVPCIPCEIKIISNSR